MQRQDYVLRLIEQLGAFLRQAWVLRKGGKPDEAIIAVVRAQETLMGVSASEFSQWDLAQQFDRLTQAEEPRTACEKVFAYAALMDAVADAYRDKDLGPLADGAAMFGEGMRALAFESYPSEAGTAQAKVGSARLGAE